MTGLQETKRSAASATLHCNVDRPAGRGL